MPFAPSCIVRPHFDRPNAAVASLPHSPLCFDCLSRSDSGLSLEIKSLFTPVSRLAAALLFQHWLQSHACSLSPPLTSLHLIFTTSEIFARAKPLIPPFTTSTPLWCLCNQLDASVWLTCSRFWSRSRTPYRRSHSTANDLARDHVGCSGRGELSIRSSPHSSSTVRLFRSPTCAQCHTPTQSFDRPPHSCAVGHAHVQYRDASVQLHLFRHIFSASGTRIAADGRVATNQSVSGPALNAFVGCNFATGTATGTVHTHA